MLVCHHLYACLPFFSLSSSFSFHSLRLLHFNLWFVLPPSLSLLLLSLAMNRVAVAHFVVVRKDKCDGSRLLTHCWKLLWISLFSVTPKRIGSVEVVQKRSVARERGLGALKILWRLRSMTFEGTQGVCVFDRCVVGGETKALMKRWQFEILFEDDLGSEESFSISISLTLFSLFLFHPFPLLCFSFLISLSLLFLSLSLLLSPIFPCPPFFLLFFPLTLLFFLFPLLSLLFSLSSLSFSIFLW